MAKIFKNYLLIDDESPLEFQPSCENHVGVVAEGVVGLVFSGEFATAAQTIVDHKNVKCDVLDTLSGIILFFDRKDHTCADKIFTTSGLQCNVIVENAEVTLEQTVEDVKKRSVDGESFDEIIETQFVSEFTQTYSELFEIPVYLRPLNKVNAHFLAEDTSGNSALFTHIQVLQTAKYNKTEIQEILKTINKLILCNPVTDEELIAITSDDAFSEDMFFGEKGRFLHNVFGDYMLANSEILLLDDQLHIYTRDKNYSNEHKEFQRIMLDKLPTLKDTQRNEVYKYIELQCRRRGEHTSPRILGLKDQVLDIETMETAPYSPEVIISNRIDYNYNPSAYSEVVDKFLDSVTCGDKQLRSIVEEMIGYTLYRSNLMQYTFFLTGGAGNGKSTLLKMMQVLVGKRNSATISLKDLETTYGPAELYGKLVNFGDDIGSDFFNASDVFKKAATGEAMSVRRIYGQLFELRNYATMIYCANELPPVNDRTDGFSRRMVIIPFNAKFAPEIEGYDPFIDDKLATKESQEYLLNLAIAGLLRVLTTRKFTKSDACDKEKQQFITENNPVLGWLEETETDVVDKDTKIIYDQYKAWISENGLKPLGKTKFSQELRKARNVETTGLYIKGFGTRRCYTLIGAPAPEPQTPDTSGCKDTIGV